MEKVKTSVSLDKDVYEYIQKLAERERLNVSQVINRDYAMRMIKEREGKE
jgi:predicted DNA-binding ribbon-helix-helix protein